MKLKSIDEIFNEIELIPESKLTKQYNEKRTKDDEEIRKKINMKDEGFGQYIGSPGITSADFTEKFGLVLFNLTHDPGYDSGMKGCAYTSQIQIVDLNDNLTKLLVESFNYRETGNSPFDHSINFSQGKILEEKGDKLLYGIKSHELLKFFEINTKTKEKNLVEKVDLEYIQKNKEKLEQFDKAFKELDKKAIKTFIEEKHMFTNIEQINDDYSIAILDDPYGDTGTRHAKTKLIIKGKGIIDLEYHPKEFEGTAVTQGFDIENIKLTYDGKNVLLGYTIKEEQSGFSDSGVHWKSTLGETNHTIELDTKTYELPVNKDMKLDYLIGTETNKLLSHGNTHKIPVMMEGFRNEEPINYAYRLDKIEHEDKTFLLVSKIIDMYQYKKTDQGLYAVEQQMKTELFVAKDLEGDKPSLERIGGFTTDTNDRKEYFLNVEYNSEKNELRISKPRIEITGETLSVNYQVKGNNINEKEIRLGI